MRCVKSIKRSPNAYEVPMIASSPVLDCVGNVITPGCTVVYPSRQGSNMWMERMVVDQVESDKISGHKPNGRRTQVKKLKNVAVVVPPAPVSA